VNRLVIFDLDGVLFESRGMHYEALNRALEAYGHKPIELDEHWAMYNGLPTRTKLAMRGITGEEAARVDREKQAHTLGWVHENVRPDDALVSLFTDLRAAGWKIAVASNAITVTVIRALQLLKLWDLCDFVTAADRVAFPKPNPMMYLDCMKVCEAEPATTWIVEDSPLGREGAGKTGAVVVPVTGPADVVQAVRTVMEVNP
jgi:HAD superfamily hydrolase (TIGR01509 family)